MLETQYCSLELASPVIVGASSLTGEMKTLKQAEQAGAGAVVARSIFEEQIQFEHFRHDEDMVRYKDWHWEMHNIFPEERFYGVEEHLMWLRRAKQELSIPVIASLNAVHPETWVEYAAKIAETGVDALELNFYALPDDGGIPAEVIETGQAAIVKEVKAASGLPVSVKISPYYTNPLNFVRKLEKAGADGFVLFNRFFQPDFDIETLTNRYRYSLSSSEDYRLALRYVGLLSGKTGSSLCASGGVIEEDTVLRQILAGADAVQVVSGIYQTSMDLIRRMNNNLSSWMETQGFSNLAEFCGMLNAGENQDSGIYRRDQYVRLLLNPWKYIVKDHARV